MRRFLLLIACLLLFCVGAHADVTISQFFDNTAVGHADFDRIAQFNSDGTQTDFHDSTIIQYPAGTSNFYRYSEQYGCGSVLNNSGSWCGIHVWYSTDLGADGGPGWQHLGALFDATTYQSRCGPSAFGAFSGCWTWRWAYNAANNNWVGMMHDPSGSGQPAVFLCTTPLPGNCTEQARMTTFNCPGTVDTISLFVDNDGPPASAYLTYTCSGDGKMYADKLNSTYTNSAGVGILLLATGGYEGETMFKKGSTYYLIYQGNCGYCYPASATNYATASSPLGTWTFQGQINADTCAGQNEGLDKLTIGGTDYYLLHSDMWQQPTAGGGTGLANQGLAMEYLFPLTFTGSAIDTFPCNHSITIVNGSISPGTPITPPPADQTDESSFFTPYCDITNTKHRMQTFVPSFSGNSISVRLTTAQNLDCVWTGACGPGNSNLTVDLVTLDGSKNPVSVLGTTTITTSDVPWRLTPVTKQLTGPVVSGTEYGIRLHGTGSTGCYAFGYNDNHPYSAGVERVSTNSGSTWTTDTNRSLRFAVGTGAAVVPFSGVAH